MQREWRETGRFRALGDNGNYYTVIEWQEFVPARATEPAPGARRLCLRCGGRVRAADEHGRGCFEIVEAGELIRRIG